MHHGVRVRVFCRRSSERHSRNDSSSSSISWSHDVHVFSHIRTRYVSEVPVLHTPVEVRFSMTCRFVDGQGQRGNVHIPAIMSVAFPDVVVFDGFI